MSLLFFALRRLAAAVLLLFLVLTATFFLMHLTPGDPLNLMTNDLRASASYREQLRELYGLDQPLISQYGRWLRAVVVEGDWGRSFHHARPATEVLLEALPNTASLVLGTLLVQYGFGLWLGVVAARRRGRPLDRQIRALSLVLYALPAFWLALLAIEALAVRLRLFPAGGMSSLDAPSWTVFAGLLDRLHHLALPALVLGLASCGPIVRLVRNGLLDVLDQEYIRAARGRGLSPSRVLWIHALPNALGPVVQSLGVVLPALLSGSLIIEVIFSWPGVGRVAFLAYHMRDYPVILAATTLSAALVIAGSLLADLLHAWLDPRVREAQLHD